MRYIPTLDKVVGNCINHSSVIVVVPVKKDQNPSNHTLKIYRSYLKITKGHKLSSSKKALHGAIKEQSWKKNKPITRNLVALDM